MEKLVLGIPLKSTLARVPGLYAAVQLLKARAAWLRWRLSRPAYPAGAELRLNLGCGDTNAPGFVNVDARPAPHVHHVQRIDRLSAFADDSVTLIYVSHCLEHVPHVQVPAVLKEWRRVLKPGGTLRISVPDFDLMVDTYLDNQREMRSIQLPLMGAQDYPFNFHYVCFNAADLSRLLQEAGFRNPRRWQHGRDAFSSLPDWSGRSMQYAGRSYPVSLNLEADK